MANREPAAREGIFVEDTTWRDIWGLVKDLEIEEEVGAP